MAITHAQYVTMLQKVGKAYKEALVDFGRETATNNVISLVDDIKDNAKGDFGQELSRAADNWRQAFAQNVSGQRWKTLLDPIYKNVLRDLANNKGNLDPASNWGAIYDYHNDNT